MCWYVSLWYFRWQSLWCDILISEFVWSFRWQSLCLQVNGSCHTNAWVLSSRIQMSPVTHIDESYYTYEWAMSRIWMGHGTHNKCHATHMNTSWPEWVIHRCDIIHSLNITDSDHRTYTHTPQRTSSRTYTHTPQRPSSRTLHTHTAETFIMNPHTHTAETFITHFTHTHIAEALIQKYKLVEFEKLVLAFRSSYLWHDSFMRVTWLIHVCATTHSCVWHDSFMCVTWLIHACDMTHSCVWHD